MSGVAGVTVLGGDRWGVTAAIDRRHVDDQTV